MRAQKFFDRNAGYVFLLPWLIGLFGFTLIPMFASLYYSFTDYQMASGHNFVGLRNFVRMFTTDYHFKDAVRVTCVYVFTSVPLQITVALLLAMALNRGIPGTTALRTMFYIPSLLGASVAISVLWLQLFGSRGLLNAVLASIGFQELARISWITDPRFNLGTIVLLRVWQFGSPMVIFLAGLRQIPSDMYEAAAIDGANARHTARYITLPLLSPIILFNTVMQLIGSFKTFTEAYIVSNGGGGIQNSLLFITLHIFNEGFRKFYMGYASALAWVLLAIVAIFTLLVFKLSDRHVFYG